MIRETTICDVCEREKGENNHWFVVRTVNNIFAVYPSPFQDESQTNKDVCGSECAMKLLNEYLEQQKQRWQPVVLQSEQS